MSGIKYDEQKPQMALIPPEAILGLAQVLTFGAAKYSSRNWEQGMLWSRVFAGVQRHLWAFWSGEDIDEESGMPHLWCASAGVAFLVTYQQRRTGEDDRPPRQWVDKKETKSVWQRMFNWFRK